MEELSVRDVASQIKCYVASQDLGSKAKNKK